MMIDLSLISSSVVLLASGCLSLAISYFLRLKLSVIESLPSDLKVEVFDRSFVVFDPYPERRRSIGNISSLLITLTSIIGIVLAALFWVILRYGFALSLFIMVACLNLMFPDDLEEIYDNTQKIINAIKNGNKLGSGDLAGLRLLKNILPKMSRYYSYLSVILLIGASILSLAWNIIIPFFSRLLSLLLFLNCQSGLLGFQLVLLSFSLLTIFSQFCIAKIKRKIIKWEFSHKNVDS